MPFALLFIGLILVSAGARNRGAQLGSLLTADFTGPGNFFYWLAGIGAIGGIGYYPPLRGVSRLFLFLLVLSMLLADKGFFEQFISALSTINAPAPATEADVGGATADPMANVTGPQSDAGAGLPNAAPQTMAELTKKYGVDKIPDNAPLPTDLPIPNAAQGAAGDWKTIGDLRNWIGNLPATATVGPSQANPYVAAGQQNTPANNMLNQKFGTPPTQSGDWMSFFGGAAGKGIDFLNGLLVN